MWTASARSDRLPVAMPTTSSSTSTPTLRLSAPCSRCLWREPWVWRACTSVSSRDDQPRFTLADGLRLVEALAGLEGEAEVAERPVEGGGARVHAQDREDAAVRLHEGDVERRRH